ncbi:hypothetical protein GTQ99_02715 [Kineococcus sp. T13]|uniref:hypothetical protein n=1 Tax=Kineococcus vitellinus TaxID=2696565 RepID=UPI001412D7BE|nr:hypothetical protein [Kineococcus vitellinus]NAZ74338.1 hypothetical protein [Kineococcus vitellinus]
MSQRPDREHGEHPLGRRADAPQDRLAGAGPRQVGSGVQQVGESPVVVLGAGGTRWGAAVAAGFVALAALGWWLSPGDGFSLLYVSGQLVLAAGCVLWALLRHRLDTVRLEDGAIVVLTRRGRTTYAWADVLEVSWRAASWPYAGGGPVLRIRGGPFDEPGPNAPAQIAHLPVFGRSASQEAVGSLQQAAKAHGVPYTPKLMELIGTGKRMPRLPGEARDCAHDRSRDSTRDPGRRSTGGAS